MRVSNQLRAPILSRAAAATLLLLAPTFSPLLSAHAQAPATAPSPASAPPLPTTPKGFDAAADAALLAMRARALELKIGGVAVVAYFEGDKIQGWSSRMAVVTRMKVEPSADNKGSNLLAIAYAKASEMADTLKDSGSQVRPPLTGEFGWSGGVIVQHGSGYLIAAFSGGASEDDVKVSRAGVQTMTSRL